ncbi:hypothetical protein [Oryzobacter terrae]|uniref:hypothetical protein n=1 Tax=Oryzobacter terrae TaxID=1620385 RepID=UPI00366DE0E9
MAERDDMTPSSGAAERFRAQPAGMRTYGLKFRALGDDAAEAITYAETWVDFDPSGGAVFERFVDVTTGMDTGVRDLMKDIHAAVSGTAAAIMASADRYEDLDAAAAQRLDESYWSN